MTQADAVKWLQSQVGKHLDFDHQYGQQCFDAFNYYYQYLTGRNPYSDGYGVPGAKDIWSVATSRFTKIANNPKDANQLPQPGDILIYNGIWGAGFGHVEMVESCDKSGVHVIGQNEHGNNTEGVVRVYRTWASCVPALIGWLHYNGFTAPTPMITQAQLNQLYKDLLGRAPDAGGTKTYLGKFSYDYVKNAIMSSPEYKNRQAALKKAQEASKPAPAPQPAPDPHTATITALQAQVKGLQDELAQADDDNADLKKTVTSLTTRQAELNKIIQVQQTQLAANKCTTTISFKQAIQVLVQAFKDWIK